MGDAIDASSQDYYDVLGVRPETSEAEINRAFRARAREWQPDRYVGAAPALREAAERDFKQVGEAYDMRRDGEARAAYDAWRARGGTFSVTVSPESVRAVTLVGGFTIRALLHISGAASDAPLQLTCDDGTVALQGMQVRPHAADGQTLAISTKGRVTRGGQREFELRYHVGPAMAEQHVLVTKRLALAESGWAWFLTAPFLPIFAVVLVGGFLVAAPVAQLPGMAEPAMEASLVTCVALWPIRLLGRQSIRWPRGRIAFFVVAMVGFNALRLGAEALRHRF
jgi:hypothetical protein